MNEAESRSLYQLPFSPIWATVGHVRGVPEAARRAILARPRFPRARYISKLFKAFQVYGCTWRISRGEEAFRFVEGNCHLLRPRRAHRQTLGKGTRTSRLPCTGKRSRRGLRLRRGTGGVAEGSEPELGCRRKLLGGS